MSKNEREIPPELENKVGNLFYEKVTGILRDNIETLNHLQNQDCINESDLLNAVYEANKSVSLMAGDDEELYQKYHYVIVKHGNKVRAVQGKVINCNPQRDEIAGDELSDLRRAK